MNQNNDTTGSRILALENEYNRLEEDFTSLIEILDGHGDTIGENDAYVRAIREIMANVKDTREELSREGRLLRLGIVGQIKAGKSSLLNLLLFGGRDVLPKAATPMTASLTHIVKSDKDEIEVEYYTHKDWQDIERHSREYEKQKENQQQGSTPSSFLQASHDIVNMVKARRLRVAQYLDKKTTIAASVDSLNEELSKLVSADGELTPLAKSVTIRCSQGLPDLDIVDTPGINDPIRSRSQQTEKLLSKCDAVLMLSYAGQFMNQEDAVFLLHRVPQEGIRRRLLIGSKFDSALIDESKKYRGDLEEANSALKETLREHAINMVVQSQDEDHTLAIKDNDILFVSAMCATLSEKPVARWSQEECGIFRSLQKSYPYWFDSPESNVVNDTTIDTLAFLGNKEEVDDRIADIRRDKDGIKQRRARKFLRKKRETVIEELDSLIGDIRHKREELDQSDREQVEQQIRSVEEVEEKIGNQIEDAWYGLIKEQTSKLNDLKEEVREESREARQTIAQGVETQPKTRKRKKSSGFLWLAKLGRKIKGASDYESQHYEVKALNTNAIRDAIDDAKDWLEDALQYLTEAMFDHSFVKKARDRTTQIVSEELSNDLAFQLNTTTIARALRQSIEKIASQGRSDIKEFDFNLIDEDDDFEDHATNLSRGQSRAREIVKSIDSRVQQWINQAKGQLDTVGDQAKQALVPAAIGELHDYYDQLKQDLSQKEFKSQRYDQVITQLEQYRRKLTQDNS